MPLSFRELLAAPAAGGRPLIGGHRGARSLAPENTLAAACRAHEAGADFWELDVALTADDRIVVIHDDTFHRTSNARQRFPDRAPWNVHAFTLAEARCLDFGSWYLESDPYGQIAARALAPAVFQSYAGVNVPTLQEALALTADLEWHVNVEIKDLSGKPGHERVVRNVIDLVRRMGMVPRVLISSFNHDYLRQARAMDGGIAIAPLVDERHLPPDAAGYLRALDAQALHPPALADLGSLLPSVRRAGYAVNVWAYHEPDETPALLAAGASGIITGFPQRMAAREGKA